MTDKPKRCKDCQWQNELNVCYMCFRKINVINEANFQFRVDCYRRKFWRPK